MLKVLGVCGEMGAGKDTLADALIANDRWRVRKYSMAEPIKNIATSTFGFTPEQMEGREAKETEDPFWNITPRRFLQLVGTDMFRCVFRQDVWVKLMEMEVGAVPEGAMLVIPDIRFDNEALKVLDLGGEIIEVVRPSNPLTESDGAGHVSEKGIDRSLITRTIVNDGSKRDFQDLVVETLKGSLKRDDA